MAGRKLITYEDYSRSLKNGYGVGEGKNYKPWLRVQDVKSHGVRAGILGYKTRRIHHMLSSLETDFFYLAEFSDSVCDIREQFPLFPLELMHKIATTLGISPPRVPVAGTLSVMTTDFLLTRQVDGQTFYEAVTVKPESELSHMRVMEKLEIERVWWELLGIQFSIYTGNEQTRYESRNIAWVTDPLRSDTAFFSDAERAKAIALLQEGKCVKAILCQMLSKQINLSIFQALALLKQLIAEKSIKVDMSYLLEDSDTLHILAIYR